MADMDVSKLIERIENMSRWNQKDYPQVTSIAAEAASALTAERERADKAEKALAGANAALSLQGYGADTHAGLVAAREKTMELAKGYKAERDDLTRKLAEAQDQIYDSIPKWQANDIQAKLTEAERQLAEAVEVVERWLKADEIGIGLDIREARESARAWLQKQAAGT